MVDPEMSDVMFENTNRDTFHSTLNLLLHYLMTNLTLIKTKVMALFIVMDHLTQHFIILQVDFHTSLV